MRTQSWRAGSPVTDASTTTIGRTDHDYIT
jgi:hypothetical protein